MYPCTRIYQYILYINVKKRDEDDDSRWWAKKKPGVQRRSVCAQSTTTTCTRTGAFLRADVAVGYDVVGRRRGEVRALSSATTSALEVVWWGGLGNGKEKTGPDSIPRRFRPLPLSRARTARRRRRPHRRSPPSRSSPYSPPPTPLPPSAEL